MGYIWTVMSWQKTDEVGAVEPMKYFAIYRGDSWIKALWLAYKEKKKGVGCVKIEWRGKWLKAK